MAKTATAEPAGMDRADLKRNLRLATDDPIQVAFALDGSGKAILQLHRRKLGRALVQQLKDDVQDSKNHRWGTAIVDRDDPKLVRLMVNKPGGGMARKLVIALKGTGFNKVKILLDDGSELETHEGEDEPDEQDADAPSPPAATAAQPEPAPDPASAGHRPEVAAVAAAAKLVGQITPLVGNDPAQRDAVKGILGKVQDALKAGTLAVAGEQVGALRDLLETAQKAAAAGAQGVDDGVVRKLRKARDVWEATLAKLTRDMEQLAKTVAAAAAGHELGDTFEAEFDKVVKPMLETLDDSLSDALHRASEAGGVEEHGRLLDEARSTLDRFRAFAGSNPVIAHLDSNPFVPLAIGKTLTASLGAVAKTLG